VTTMVEFDALVARVRRANPGAILNLSGRNANDIDRLRQLAKEGGARQAAEAAKRPIIEAGTRLHRTWERVLGAVRTIETGQEMLQKARAVHVANGVPEEFFDPVAELKKPECPATVAGYDAANETASVLAQELETRAHKIRSYVNGWEKMDMAQQNRSLIMALADRLDRLEEK
jgi:hypothetical protein